MLRKGFYKYFVITEQLQISNILFTPVEDINFQPKTHLTLYLHLGNSITHITTMCKRKCTPESTNHQHRFLAHQLGYKRRGWQLGNLSNSRSFSRLTPPARFQAQIIGFAARIAQPKKQAKHSEPKLRFPKIILQSIFIRRQQAGAPTRAADNLSEG